MEKEFKERARLYGEFMLKNGCGPEDRSTDKSTAIGWPMLLASGWLNGSHKMVGILWGITAEAALGNSLRITQATHL